MLTDTQFVSLNFKFSKENQQYRLDISHFVIVVHIYLGAENKKKSKVYTKKAYKLGKWWKWYKAFKLSLLLTFL